MHLHMKILSINHYTFLCIYYTLAWLVLQMWLFNFLSSFIDGSLRKLVIILVSSEKILKMDPTIFIGFVFQEMLQ